MTTLNGLLKSRPFSKTSIRTLLGSVYLSQPQEQDATRVERHEGTSTTIQDHLKRDLEWFPIQTDYRGPRHVTVLCHGLGFFDKTPEVLPTFQLHYWGSIVEALRKIGTQVIIARVPSTGTIAERARALHNQLEKALEPGTEVNFLAHSMGGLDCRHLITHVSPQTYRAASLTTLSCPHRGSPFMDWCRDYLGLGRIIPKLSQANAESTTITSGPNTSIEDEDFIRKKTAINKAMPISSAILTKTMLARTIDCPAYANLTTAYCQKVFNPLTPDNDQVKYFSFAASTPSSSFPLWHPLYLPYLVVSQAEGPVNDGLVSVESSKWGEHVGTVECDHWTMRGRGLPGSKFDVDEFYRGIATFLYGKGF